MNSFDEKERWVQIPGFPDHAVSTHGRVYHVRLDHILAPRPAANNNKKVQLRLDGRPYERMVHRLVAEAFLDDYSPHVNIKHIDDDNSNNHYQNLKMDVPERGEFEDRNWIDEIKVRRVRIVGTEQTFPNVEKCAAYVGTDPGSIYRVLNGTRRSAKGYTYEYVWM